MAVGNVEATTAWTQLALVYTGMEQRGSGSMGFPQACECQMDKYPGNSSPGQSLFLRWICACMDSVNRG